MTLAEYDAFCRKKLPKKIPDVNHVDYNRRVGDCIYDYGQNNQDPLLREGVHNDHPDTIERDLGGKHALLSNHFYYFGNEAIEIPDHLKSIVLQGQGHRSNLNEPYKEDFILWIESLKYPLNYLHGQPQIRVNFDRDEEGKLCVSTQCAPFGGKKKVPTLKFKGGCT